MTALSTEAIVGASATYYIGSDAYHKIIIRVERKGQKIFVHSAREILKASGLTLEQWNELSDNDRAFETSKAYQIILDQLIELDRSWGSTKEQAFRYAQSCLSDPFTKRRDGNYRGIGEDFGSLVIGEQYEHRDPHF